MKDKGTMDRLDEEKKTKFILILKVRLSLELKLHFGRRKKGNGNEACIHGNEPA